MLFINIFPPFLKRLMSRINIISLNHQPQFLFGFRIFITPLFFPFSLRGGGELLFSPADPDRGRGAIGDYVHHFLLYGRGVGPIRALFFIGIRRISGLPPRPTSPPEVVPRYFWLGRGGIYSSGSHPRPIVLQKRELLQLSLLVFSGGGGKLSPLPAPSIQQTH